MDLIRIGEQLKLGDRVMIKDGSLRTLVGVFEKETKESERISLSPDDVELSRSGYFENDLIRKIS